MTNGYRTGDSYEEWLEHEKERQDLLTKLLIYEISKEEEYLDLQQCEWNLECWKIVRVRFELLERVKLNLWENFIGFYVKYARRLRSRYLFILLMTMTIIIPIFLFANIAVL